MARQVCETDWDGDTEVLEIDWDGRTIYVRVAPDGTLTRYQFTPDGQFQPVTSLQMVLFVRQYLATRIS